MSSPADAALSFEAVKIAMSQTKDGIKITLVIHPNDNTNDLFSHHVGSRYQVAMVLLDDEGQPVMPKGKTDAQRAVTAAVMLCKDKDFIGWLHETDSILEPTEEAATAYLYGACDIKSRAELATSKHARDIFEGIRSTFIKATGGFP